MTESKAIELAGRLGYAYTQHVDPKRPLREYVLPRKPFIRIWPFVIIRELVLDIRGETVKKRNGKPRLTHIIRRLPA